MTRETVEPTKRRAMTPARRLRIWERDGRQCYLCHVPVPLKGTVMEHPIQVWMGGSDEDADIHPICPDCDKPKTAKDAKVRAHVKRLIKKNDPDREKKPSRLQGRGFGDQKRKIPSRGFDKKKPAHRGK